MSAPTAHAPTATHAWWHSTRNQGILLGLLTFILFWWRLGTMGLIDPDEPFYAQTTREMLAKGDWLTPWLFGEPQFEKPILFYWEMMLSVLTLGESEFAVRLPGALATTGLVLLIWRMGAKMFNPLAGFCSALIFATGIIEMIMSRMVLTDMSHAFFITASMYLLWLAFTEEAQRTKHLLWAAVASALAMLTKGPQNLVMTLMVTSAFALICRRSQPWSLRTLLLAGLLWLAIAGPWYLAMFTLHHEGHSSPNGVTGWGYYGDVFFIHENLGRFLHAEHQGNNTWYYYLGILVGGTLPWIPVTLVALYEATRKTIRAARENEALTFTFLWLTLSLLFMTIAQSKLPSYIFFLFVPLSLLSGPILARWLTAGFASRTELILTAGLTFFQAVVLIGYPIMTNSHAREFMPQLVVLGVPFLVAGVWSLRGQVSRWMLTSMVFTPVLVFCVFYWVGPKLESTTGSRDICARVAEFRQPGEKLITCSFLGRSANYYLKEKPVAIFVAVQKDKNFRPFYPFYAYHALPQVSVEQGLGVMADQAGTLFCLAEARDFTLLNESPDSSVKGRCELLFKLERRALIRIHARGWIAPQSPPVK